MNIKKKKEVDKKSKDRKNSLSVRVVGWAGSILIITAYTLNSLGYLNSDNLIYPILNLIGAFFMGVRVFADRNWSNFFLEVFWASIAVVSIVKFFIY